MLMSPRIGLDLPTLLQATAELADTHGIDQLNLAMVAKSLNIKTPSLYNHVDGLGGLRKKLTVYGLEKLYERLAEAALGRSGDDAVHALSRAYMAFARQHPGLYDTVLRAPDPQDNEVQQAGKPIIELIIQALSVYNLQDEAVLHAVRGLRSILHGFASLEQIGGFGLPLDSDKTIRLLIDAFLAGIYKMK
jgi:AcrR family transcriptional regulator